MIHRRVSVLLVVLAISSFVFAAPPEGNDATKAPADSQPFQPAPITVPDGYTVELVAGPPLVRHPVMAGFDERGRLFVAEPDGRNLKRADLEKHLPGEVRLLEDTDGDGKFDKSTVFVDKLTFPQGALWHDGALYVCSSGALWKFVDTDGDDKADERIKLVGDFGWTGNAADVHGPFLGPAGRLWWCQGRHGHEIKDKTGKVISRGKAARIFNCKLDGSDLQTWATGGMDNPVEIVFTPEGDVIGTCNLFYSNPRGDTLVHWVYGGVYPRKDFVDKLSDEFIFTGELLPEIHNFGHVAVSGLCLYRSEHFGPNPAAGPNPKPGDPHIVFVTEFNTGKVKRVELSRKGSTYAATKIEEFLSSQSPDFHPTDVLEDADGSLLVIDTGGWFRIGCPVSQVAKPEVRGGIYRIRKKDGKVYEDPWGLKLDWAVADHELFDRWQRDDRFAVRDRCIALLNHRGRVRPHEGERESTRHVFKGMLGSRSIARARIGASWIARLKIDNATPALLSALARSDVDPMFEHALIHGLIKLGDRDAVAKGLQSDDARVRRGAAIALEQMRRKRDPGEWRIEIPAPATGQPLDEAAGKALVALGESLPAGDVGRGAKVFAGKTAACATCHRVNGDGAQLGPDLSTIGAIRQRADLLESILHPSASYARGFEPYTVRTTDGDVHSGVIVGETRDTIRLAVGADKTVTIKADDIESIKPGEVSTMPAGMNKALNTEELADLVAYLESLK